ncbi:MAG TPA: hypothetical protein VH500_04085 [Nitrososphaeraceae archaeon]|jgi:hypothetical protein
MSITARASALKKVFYIGPGSNDKPRQDAIENSIFIDNYAKTLLSECFILKEFLEAIDLDSY